MIQENLTSRLTSGDELKSGREFMKNVADRQATSDFRTGYQTDETTRAYLDRLSKSNEAAMRNLTEWDSPRFLLEFYDTWIDIDAARDRHKQIFSEEFPDREFFICTGVEHQLNARTFIVPDDATPVIMMNDKLFDFIARLSWLFAAARVDSLSSRKSNGWTRFEFRDGVPRLKKGRRLNRLTSEFVNWVAAPVGESGLLGWNHTDDASSDVALALFDCMKYFAIGHEISHCHLDHFGLRKMWSLGSDRSPHRNDYAEEFIRSWNEEHEADISGGTLAMLIGAGNGYTTEVVQLAVHLLMTGMSWIQMIDGSAAKDSEDIKSFSTHPPVAKRIDMLRWRESEIKRQKIAVELAPIDLLDAEMRRVIEKMRQEASRQGHR